MSAGHLICKAGRAGTLLGVLAIALLAGVEKAPAGAALHVVNSPEDQPDASIGDTICDVDLVAPGLQCTLRAAFQELVAGTVVNFNIPGCPPACTISPSSALPSLANNNEIDGTSQPGFSGTPLITIDGTNIGNGPGINLGSSRISVIRGLVIRDVPDDPGISGGAVDFLEVSDSIISGNALSGVNVLPPIGPPQTALKIVLTNSQFTGNGSYGVLGGTAGLPFLDATITGSTFSENGADGIRLYLFGGLIFDNNVASSNGFDGASIVGGSQNAIDNANVSGNVFEGNGLNGFTTGAVGYVGFSSNQARNNGSDGADLANSVNERLEADGNILEDNDGNGLRIRATGDVSLTGNSIARNGGDGANVVYEQYTGPGVPPPAALTVTENQITGNVATGFSASDEFQDFPLIATANTFAGNADGISTSATSVSVSGNTFDQNTSHGFYSTNPDAGGSVFENILTLNGTALLLNGAGVSAHFNRISGNTLGVVNLGAGITNAENNWWGCNDGPASAPCDTRGQAVDGDPWLVMTPSADPAAITVGQTSSILADFRVNSDGQNTSPSGNIPDGAMVEFGTDLGNFDGDPIMQAPTSAGIAGVTLTADEGPGTAHVTVGLDAAGLSVDVLITGDGTQSPTPTPTTGATPTPTPTSTATATPTPTPTPTGTGAAELTQGDVDCNGDVSSVDALKELRHVAQLSVSQNEPCPNIGEDVASFWGDVDCSGSVTSVDALKILRFVAQLSVSQNEPCPDVGMPKGG